jgi:hypothetical protein
MIPITHDKAETSAAENAETVKILENMMIDVQEKGNFKVATTAWLDME